MLSTHRDVEPKRRGRIQRQLVLWLVFALPLVATVARSQQEDSTSDSFFGNGGPWMALANIPECSSLGRVCAEWPFQNGGQKFVAVCCIVPGDLGSTRSPDHACGEGGMVVFRRGDDVGESW